MTADLLTPNNVEQSLIWLSQALNTTVTELARLDEQFVRAKHRYELAYARAFLTAEGAMDIRRYTATVETEQAKFDYEIAEQQVRSCRDRLRTLSTRVDISRSLRASVGSAMALGSPGAP